MFLLPMIVAGMLAFHLSGNWPISSKERIRIFVVWLGITAIAFVMSNYWILMGAIFGVLLAAAPREPSSRVMWYIIFLTALPFLNKELPGLGPIRYLMDLQFPRLLIFGLLMPLMFLPGTNKYGKRMPFLTSPVDKYVLLLLIADIAVSSRGRGGTEIVRLSVVYFIDFFAVYFVISRHIRTFEELARCFAGLILASSILAFCALIEASKSWKMYNMIYPNIGIQLDHLGNWYEWRNGILRTSVTMGIPIILGCFFTYAMAALLATKQHLKSKFLFWGFTLLFIVASYTTVSRGAWIGFGVVVLVYLFFTSRSKFMITSIVGVIAIIFAGTSSNPEIRAIYELLPFTGSSHDITVDYRVQLLQNSIEVMKQNIWLGAPDFLATSELEDLRQGQGIIDIVNSYVQFGLRGGIVLIGMFLLLMFYILLRLLLALRSLTGFDRNICVGLISIIISHLVMIFTVSQVSYLSYLQWQIIGLSAACIHVHMAQYGARRVGKVDTGSGTRPRGPMPYPSS